MRRGGNPRADFSVAALSEPVHTNPQLNQKAEENLRRLHEEGKLPPLEDWDGDTIDGYLDMLGLNGRRIRYRRSVGTAG